MPEYLTQERRNKIVQKLMLDGKLNANELARIFSVSAETIRKDLIYLEKQGLAKKGYGGAVITNELLEHSFIEKSVEHPAEKAGIAQRAADMVGDGAVIILDSGSTVLKMVKFLTLKKGITVFTNSLRAAQQLSDFNIKVYLPGGEVRNTSNALVGGWATRAFGEIKADMAFMGTSGFKGRSGPCVENFPETEVKKAMIASAHKAVVLADSSKAELDAMIQFARWEDINTLITDKGIPKDHALQLERKTNLIIV